MQFNKDIIRDAKINKGDAAKIFGVSRTTIHNWYNGLCVHPLIKDKVTDTLYKISQATNDKKLPLQNAGTADERVSSYKRILSMYA